MSPEEHSCAEPWSGEHILKATITATADEIGLVPPSSEPIWQAMQVLSKQTWADILDPFIWTASCQDQTHPVLEGLHTTRRLLPGSFPAGDLQLQAQGALRAASVQLRMVMRGWGVNDSRQLEGRLQSAGLPVGQIGNSMTDVSRDLILSTAMQTHNTVKIQ